MGHAQLCGMGHGNAASAGAHEAPGAGKSIDGQELYWAELPVEGDEWYMKNDWEHRDAAFEEILHLVHDTGIGKRCSCY